MSKYKVQEEAQVDHIQIVAGKSALANQSKPSTSTVWQVSSVHSLIWHCTLPSVVMELISLLIGVMLAGAL